MILFIVCASFTNDIYRHCPVTEGKASLDDCRIMHFQPPTLQSRFVGHVIRTLSVLSGTACEASCFDDDDCTSINLGPQQQGKHICELSSSDHNIPPKDLSHKQGFIYKSVWVSYCNCIHACYSAINIEYVRICLCII